MDKHLTEQINRKTSTTMELTKNSIPMPNTDSDIVQSFEGPPIEDLITAPIIAAAKGQQELTSVYIDNLMHLAHSDEIHAPLPPLEPVPTFTMPELPVGFSIDVKTPKATQSQTKPETRAVQQSTSAH